jgi:hypothetical protein
MILSRDVSGSALFPIQQQFPERVVARLRSAAGTMSQGSLAAAFQGLCDPMAWRMSLVSSCSVRRISWPASLAISNRFQRTVSIRNHPKLSIGCCQEDSSAC